MLVVNLKDRRDRTRTHVEACYVVPGTRWRVGDRILIEGICGEIFKPTSRVLCTRYDIYQGTRQVCITRVLYQVLRITFARYKGTKQEMA